MDKQTAFDTVAEGLIAQGVACVAPDGSCLYRNDLGHKCAMGLLIPDANYEPGMEGMDAEGVVHRYPGLEKFQGIGWFLNELQSAHDRYLTTSLSNWRAEMERLGQRHDLSTRALDAFNPEMEDV